MIAAQLALPTFKTRVEMSIARLRQFEPEEGYYLAFSGGKDSITIYRLAQLAGVRFDAHYHNTTVDPPELVRFIKEHYPTVARDRPEMSMFRLILHKKWPPMRVQRYCCEHLKEGGGEGRFVVTGIRAEESPRRAKRGMVESCTQGRAKRYLHPIIDWTEIDVWQFIHEQELPYCSLYDEGFKRLGCILCPMARAPERDAARWPQFRKAYVRTFDRLIALREAEGLPNEKGFTCGEDMYQWWTQRHTKRAPQEARLFD